MVDLFVYGSHSGQSASSGSVIYGQGYGSSHGASSSNSQSHDHIPATTWGTIIQQPQSLFRNSHQNSVETQTFGPNASLSFPPGHHDQSYGYGFMGQSSSGNQQGFKSQNFNTVTGPIMVITIRIMATTIGAITVSEEEGIPIGIITILQD